MFDRLNLIIITIIICFMGVVVSPVWLVANQPLSVEQPYAEAVTAGDEHSKGGLSALSPSDNVQPVTTFVYASGFIVAFLACFIFVVWLLLQFDKSYRARLSALSQRKSVVLVTLLLFFLAMVGLGGYAMHALGEKQQQTVADLFASMLASTHSAVKNTIEQEFKVTKELSESISSCLLQEEIITESAISACAEDNLHSSLGRFDLQIVSPQRKTIYSKFSSFVGKHNEISSSYSNEFEQAFTGKTVAIARESGMPLLENEKGQAFAEEIAKGRFLTVSPLYNNKREVLAVVVVPSLTFDNISVIFEGSRVGVTGEMYLVSSDGFMLTKSRFHQRLVGSSRLKEDELTYLKLEQPLPQTDQEDQDLAKAGSNLTLLANELVQAKSNHNYVTYHNYLGDKVIGVWEWDKDLGVGFAAEISLKEIREHFAGSIHIVQAGVITCTALGFVLFLLIFFYGEARSRVLRKSNDRWQELAGKRLNELREREELYSLVLNSTNDGIWDWNLTTGELSFSDQYLGILGYSSGEFVYHIDEWTPFIHPEDRVKLQQAYTPCLEGKIAKFTAVFRMRHKKGYWVWVQGSGIHVKDDQGKIIRLVGTHEDITIQRIAEVELEQRERKFSAVFNQSVNFVGILDADGRVLEFNDYAQRITSQNIEDIAGLMIWETPWVESSSGLPEYFQELVRKVIEGTQVSFEREMVAYGNRNFIFNMTVSPIRDDGGKVQLILLTGHDVTQTRNAEKFLRSSEQRFRSMFQNFPVVYYSIDREGYIKDCNDMFTEVLGYRRSEVLEQRIDDFYIPEHRLLFSERVELLGQEGVFEGETTLIHKNGREISFILTSRAQYDVSGQFVRSHTMLVDITERKKVELLQARFNAVLENTPAAICMQDLQGKFLFINDAWSRYLNLKPEKVEGKTATDIFPQHEAAAITQIFENVLETDESTVWEMVHLFNGKEHFFQTQSFPIRDGENNVQAIGHISTEITERKIAQMELRKAQAILKSVMSNSQAMVFAKNLDGEYVMMNESFCSFWGLDPIRDLGKGDRELYTEEIASKYRESDFEVIATGKPVSEESTIISPVNGAKQTMYVEKFPIYDEDGEINGTGVIASDITPVKDIQELLKESEERLRFSLASMGTYYWEYNFPADQLVYDSADYFAQFGYTQNEIPTNMRSYRGFIHEDDVDKVDELFSAHVNRKLELFKAEYRFKAQGGKWFWNLDIGRVVERDSAGNPLKLAGITIDISERKEMEAWLNLEREKAEAAALAKTQFMANMSHEIRTPMNAIIGLCYLMGKTQLDNKQQSFLQKIDSSSKSLLSIINDILDFSKIEAGKVALEDTSFELNQVINQLNSYFGHLALSKGLALHFDVDESIPAVLRGDSHRLQQILTNLISNAVKFTEKGSVVVSASVVEKNQDDITLNIEVRDTGIGIEENEINKIFQAFSQADESTTRRFGGTGLGLSITHSLVQMMGGRIEVASEVGQGTVFVVVVTFRLGENIPKQFVGDSSVPDLSSKKILLAEDNLLNQEVIIGVLEDTGCDITAVEDGQQALFEMKKGIYDVVLMDVQMGTMDGLEATKTMRDWEVANDRPRLPIIAITADVLAEDQEKTKTAGMDGHLNKPISPKEVFDELSRWTGASEKLQTKVEGEYELIGEIAGMNVSIALARLGGRKDLLLRLLKQLCIDHSRVAEQIHNALGAEDYSLAENIAHSLKGLAGTIEANELRKTARHLENAIKAGDEGVFEFLTLLTEQTAELIVSIKEFLAVNDHKIETITSIVSIDELQDDLDELTHNLSSGNPKALSLIQSLIDKGLSDANYPQTEQLKILIERFDFEEALKLIQNR